MRAMLAIIAVVAITGCGTVHLPEFPQQDIPVVLPPPDQDQGEWAATSECVLFAPSPAGWVEIETRGISHQDGRNDDGGWEYIFLTLHGSGFDRVILFHAGGSGRKVRFKVGTAPMQTGLCTDNLPDAHTWRVTWGGGEMMLLLDGLQIGRTEAFSGTPDRVIFGGYDDSRRDFRGSWRNGRAGTDT